VKIITHLSRWEIWFSDKVAESTLGNFRKHSISEPKAQENPEKYAW